MCGFKSPYNENYAESHAGGRSALALRFAGYDALVVTGRAARPSVLVVGSRRIELLDVHYLWGADVFTTGKLLRKIAAGASGHRSILRIGPAGENGCAYACINVDTYRHFGRLGAGAVLGAKQVKGIVIQGDADLPLPEDKGYAKLFKDIHEKVTSSGMEGVVHAPHGHGYTGRGEQGKDQPVRVEPGAVYGEKKNRRVQGQGVRDRREGTVGRDVAYAVAQGGKRPGQLRFQKPGCRPGQEDGVWPGSGMGRGGRGQGQPQPGQDRPPKRRIQTRILAVEKKTRPGDPLGGQLGHGQRRQVGRDGGFPGRGHGPP